MSSFFYPKIVIKNIFIYMNVNKFTWEEIYFVIDYRTLQQFSCTLPLLAVVYGPPTKKCGLHHFVPFQNCKTYGKSVSLK
jgi:hypothetical protein